MLLEGLQPLHQVVAGEIEIFEYGLEPFRSGRFDSNQRALDIRSSHGVEKFGVLAGFHGDLGKEHHVLWQFGQLAHQLKSLGANTLQLGHACGVSLLFRQAKIGKADGIEIVVGKRDKSKSSAAQIDNLSHNDVRGTRPRLLAIGTPDRAERTVLRDSREQSARRPTYTCRAGPGPIVPAGTDRRRFGRRRRSVCAVPASRSAITFPQITSPSPFTMA